MSEIRRQTVGCLVSFLQTLDQEKPVEVIGEYTECEIVGAFVYDKLIQLIPETFDDEEMIKSSGVPIVRYSND